MGSAVVSRRLVKQVTSDRSRGTRKTPYVLTTCENIQEPFERSVREIQEPKRKNTYPKNPNSQKGLYVYTVGPKVRVLCTLGSLGIARSHF